MKLDGLTPEHSPQSTSLSESVRPVKIEDFPWVLGVAQRAFTDLDKTDCANFLYFAINSPSFYVVRTDHAFGCCYFESWPFNMKMRKAYEVFLADDGTPGSVWGVNTVTKAMIAWARQNGCANFRLESQTAYDLAPIARRNGFEPQHTAYILNLTPMH